MNADRRSFLGMLGAALACAAAVPVATVRDTAAAGERDAGEAPIPPLDERGRRILRFASMAPSGHNTQPWSVRVRDARDWTIRSVSARRLPAVDPHDRELTLSIGAFVENLVLAASALGLGTDVDVTESATQPSEFVHVRLRENGAADHPVGRIESRRTVRNGLVNRELSGSVLNTLCGPLGDRFVYYSRSSAEARWLTECTISANRQQTWRDDAQRELSRWLRFDDRQAAELRDGLTTDGMEITGLIGWYVRHFMKPADAMTKSFRDRSIDSAARLAGEGAGWIVVTGDGATRAGLIETGRRFERMALLARECGIGIHPMTQVLEEEPWRSAITGELGLPESPQFVLRVGFVDPYPQPVTPRRSVSAFVERV